MLHEERERQLGRHRVALNDVDAVAAEDGGGGELHLVVGEVLAKAEARAAVEGGELVGGLAHEAAVLEPPLRPVLPAVLPPDALHPPHGVHGVDHLGALLQHRAVREHLVLHNLMDGWTMRKLCTCMMHPGYIEGILKCLTYAR